MFAQTILQRFISFLFRPPQREGFSRAFLPIGILVVIVAAWDLSAHNNLPWLFTGLGQTAVGGAEYLPTSQRIMSGILRLSGLAFLLISICLLLVT